MVREKLFVYLEFQIWLVLKLCMLTNRYAWQLGNYCVLTCTLYYVPLVVGFLAKKINRLITLKCAEKWSASDGSGFTLYLAQLL